MQSKVNMYINKSIIGVLLFVLPSCKKLVQIPAPATSVNAINVYSNDATAISTLTGMYIYMGSSSSFTGKGGISLQVGLSADEFELHNSVSDERLVSYYKNNLSSLNYGSEYWGPFYTLIFRCNSALEGINMSADLSLNVKQQLLGEAKFLRAFTYFYLVNLYGEVPLALTTDYKVNSSLFRASEFDVYQQIITDLKEAQALLSENYLDGNLKKYTGTPERVRPTKWAAMALLARVYLHLRDYQNAEATATMVINNSTAFNLTSLNKTFLKNSNEAIWQLQPVVPGHNTEEGWIFIINGLQGNNKPIYLSQSLLNIFESDDGRKSNWIKDTVINSVRYSYPYKYRSAKLNDPLNEYLMVLRLGEQYLIRAEARAQQNDITGAQNDLNAIRIRALLKNINTPDRALLLNEIFRERQVELFTEWGNRWLDLKRTDSVDAVMSKIAPLKGAQWNSFQKLYPISLSELQKQPNLMQNSGY